MKELLTYDWTLDGALFWKCMIVSLVIVLSFLIYEGVQNRKQRNRNNEL